MPGPSHPFAALLQKRIVVLDGAMGTTLQRLGLTEADYRGERFRDWKGKDLKGAIELLLLTKPEAVKHAEKRTLFDLLEAEKICGIKLTESFAMHPGASVSGLYFSHPDAKYFGVGKIALDQVKDYAARTGLSVTEIEKRLAPNLGYEPEK